MRKFLVLALVLITTLAQAQQPWQKDKTYKPYASGSVAYANKEMWSAIEGGVQNNSTQFTTGFTSYLWDSKGNIAWYGGASKRVFVVNRMEGWAGASTSTNLEFNSNFNVNPIVKLKYHADKALILFVHASTTFVAPDFKFNQLQPGGGVAIVIRGNPHSPY